MEPYIEKIVNEIHCSKLKICLVVAGAGNQAVSWLLNVPGASNTILDISIPYSENAMSEILDGLPESIVSQTAACSMAVRSFINAKRYCETETEVLGISCTATIATNREKRGDHRVVIGVCSQNKLRTYSLILTKGARNREQEDLVVSTLLLHVIAQYSGTEFDLDNMLMNEEIVELHDISAFQCLNMVRDGDIPFVLLGPDQTMNFSLPPIESSVIFPGSFNPLHAGHKALKKVMGNEFGLSTVYETSIVNVDKPPLAIDDIMSKVSQFEFSEKLLITNQATFVGKAKHLKKYRFLVGWDTAKRIIDPKYYSDERDMLKKLGTMLGNGNRFYVAGRLDDGVFKGIQDLDLPEGLSDLFVGIPEELFRADISSTEIRQNE
tara:strand:+ start:7300 stop:8439 length:1140 start_codon:yes stop_codon:yes gene_type:complete